MTPNVRRKFARAAAATGICLMSIPSPDAYGQTEHRADARDDAPNAIDISGATYTHSQRRVRVVAHIPRLGNSGSAALSITRFTIFEAGYVVEIKKRAGHPARVKLYFYDHFGLEPRRCPEVDGSWGEDEIRLRVARSCLAGHKRERLFVQFGIQHGTAVDRAPAVKRLQRG